MYETTGPLNYIQPLKIGQVMVSGVSIYRDRNVRGCQVQLKLTNWRIIELQLLRPYEQSYVVLTYNKLDLDIHFQNV
jgi:hypothetical protein